MVPDDFNVGRASDAELRDLLINIPNDVAPDDLVADLVVEVLKLRALLAYEKARRG